MKKIILSSGLMLALFLTSCKKDYVCECTENYGGGDVVTTNTSITNVNKSGAKANCVSLKDYSEDGVASTYTKTCKIK
jgi:hypothetical protein